MKKVLSCLFVALFLLLPARAQAWHDAGHMIVAQIAYLRLTPAAKARVDRPTTSRCGRCRDCR